MYASGWVEGMRASMSILSSVGKSGGRWMADTDGMVWAFKVFRSVVLSTQPSVLSRSTVPCLRKGFVLARLVIRWRYVRTHVFTAFLDRHHSVVPRYT